MTSLLKFILYGLFSVSISSCDVIKFQADPSFGLIVQTDQDVLSTWSKILSTFEKNGILLEEFGSGDRLNKSAFSEQEASQIVVSIQQSGVVTFVIYQRRIISDKRLFCRDLQSLRKSISEVSGAELTQSNPQNIQTIASCQL